MENLDPQFLEVKKAELTEQFNKYQGEVKQIEIQETALAQKKNAINLEMLRLQGKHALIDELLGRSTPAEEVTPQT